MKDDIRVALRTSFKDDGSFIWKCPKCGSGRLFVKKESLATAETRDSKWHQKHEGGDPEEIGCRFSCLLECDSESCRDPVAVCGVVRIEPTNYENDPNDGCEKIFVPKGVLPSPLGFKPPDGCAQKVLAVLHRAFSLFWHDPPSCANAIRSVIEMVLTEKGVKTTELKNRRRWRLSLHERILIFAGQRPELKESMLAVKWIGNAGSHADGSAVTQDDLFDGFELLRSFLSLVYGADQKALEKLAKEIVRKKGPLSRERERR